MAKSELGTKRVCPRPGASSTTSNKTPVVSPYTGKVVPIAPAPRARAGGGRAGGAPRPAPVEEVEAVVPETADAEFVSLEDADAEAQGKKTAPAEGEAAPAEEEVEIDESLDDAAFIEEQEEGDPDVSDIIGEGIEKEEET